MMYHLLLRSLMEEFGLTMIPVPSVQKVKIIIPKHIAHHPEHGDILFNSFNEIAFVIVAKHLLPNKGETLTCKIDRSLSERPRFFIASRKSSKMWNKTDDTIEDIVYPFYIDGDGDIVDVRTLEKNKNWTVLRTDTPGGRQ